MYNAIILPGLQLICCCPDQLKRIREGFSLSYSLCARVCSVRRRLSSFTLPSFPPPRTHAHTHAGISWRTRREVTVTSGFNVLLLSPWWLMQAMTVKCLKWQSAPLQLSNPQHCELRKEVFFFLSCEANLFFFFSFYRNWENLIQSSPPNHLCVHLLFFSRRHQLRFLNDWTCSSVVFASTVNGGEN